MSPFSMSRKYSQLTKKLEFYFNCGRCPLTNELLRNTTDVSLLKKLNGIEINEIQCAECNNSPLCNNETFFEKQLFCLEKLENETKLIKEQEFARINALYQEILQLGKVGN
uniref:DNA-binding protein n=1 Tax=Meloidogyne hapla TaxID=6305 RepID=A0A1I8BS25_MELHA